MKVQHPSFCIILLIVCYSAAAQKNSEKGNQQWFQYYNQLKVADKWTVLSDVGYRVKEMLSQRQRYSLRTGVGYKLTDDYSFLIGFAHSGTFSGNDKINRLEFRPYQELTMKQSQYKVAVSHRLRIEERFFKTMANGAVVGSSFNFRFRYRLQLLLPLAKLSITNPDSKLFLQVADEIFINAGKTIVYNTFDQNRFLVGPSIQFNKQLTLNLLYDYQFSAANEPATFKEDHVFWLGITHKLSMK